MSLIAHCDTNRVPEDAVRAVPQPEFTDTWHPVGHYRVLDVLEASCKMYALDITRREYSLNESGTRMFGVWDLSYTINGSCYSLGFRNAIDKSMLIGVVGGHRVFVCDNLTLTGEYLSFHKHTSGLDDHRLQGMATKALEGAWVEMEKLEMWINRLAGHELNANQFKTITYDLMDAGVFTPSNFKNFHEAHDEERGPKVHSVDFSGRKLSKWYDKDTNLYTIHNACTRLMRGASLFNVADRSKRLIHVVDDYMDRAA